jgi:hypothetical protein
MTTAMPKRRRSGSAVAGLVSRFRGHDQTTCGRDDQPPRGGFGRTQQPQYCEPEMAGQGPSRLAGGSHLRMRTEPGHGEESGQDALQRLEVV